MIHGPTRGRDLTAAQFSLGFLIGATCPALENPLVHLFSYTHIAYELIRLLLKPRLCFFSITSRFWSHQPLMEHVSCFFICILTNESGAKLFTTCSLILYKKIMCAFVDVPWQFYHPKLPVMISGWCGDFKKVLHQGNAWTLPRGEESICNTRHILWSQSRSTCIYIFSLIPM